MILGVANVEEMLVLTEDVTQALRVVELSLIERTVDQTNLAVSNLFLEAHGPLINHD